MQNRSRLFFTLGIIVLAATTLTWTAFAQQYNQWSGWMGTNTSGIEYRYEVTGLYVDFVQFRNDTNSAVNIDYAVWVPSQNQAQTGTTYAKANDTSGYVGINTTNGQPPSRVEVQTR